MSVKQQEILETLAESQIPIKVMIADKLFVEGGKPREMTPAALAEFVKTRKFTSMVDTIKMPADQVKKIKELMKKSYAEVEALYKKEGLTLQKMTSKELFEISSQTSKKLCLVNLGTRPGYSHLSIEILNSKDQLCYGGVMRLTRESANAIENHDYIIDYPEIDDVRICIDGYDYRGVAAHLNHSYSEETLKEEFDLPNNDPEIESMARSTFKEDFVWLTDLEIFWPTLRPLQESIPAFTLQSFDYQPDYWRSRKLELLYFDTHGRELSQVTLRAKHFELTIESSQVASSVEHTQYDISWENFYNTYVKTDSHFVVTDKRQEKCYYFTPASVQKISQKMGNLSVTMCADFTIPFQYFQDFLCLSPNNFPTKDSGKPVIFSTIAVSPNTPCIEKTAQGQVKPESKQAAQTP